MGEREEGKPAFGDANRKKAIPYVHLWIIVKEQNVSPMASEPRIRYLKRNFEKSYNMGLG